MSAPSTNPIQKPRNSFPAWRLPKGVINAADAQLEGASSSCERWQWGCAGLVVAAVLGELAIAAVHPPYDSPLNEWGTALADAAIALGIVGEVIFGRLDARIQTELRRRSNEQLASATESAASAYTRAAEAQEELRKFRTPRAHLVTAEAKTLLIEQLVPFKGTIFVVGHDDLDREVWDFLWVLEPIIREAGWVHADWQGGIVFKKNAWPENHWYGRENVVNVSVEVHGPTPPMDDAAALESTALGGGPVRAASALTKALQAIGIEAARMPPNNSSLNPDVVCLLVGPKR